MGWWINSAFVSNYMGSVVSLEFRSLESRDFGIEGPGVNKYCKPRSRALYRFKSISLWLLITFGCVYFLWILSNSSLHGFIVFVRVITFMLRGTCFWDLTPGF
ncbi:hypothetical protein TWF225_000670 [Orbilia oligospora]|nr:hypothetical protein TWF225_000670 [Orbilia oligospora]KAF3267562.1 hypothetical protein TWF128_009094 [Orbilia oligospora]